MKLLLDGIGSSIKVFYDINENHDHDHDQEEGSILSTVHVMTPPPSINLSTTHYLV